MALPGNVKFQPKLLNVNRIPGKPKKRRKVTLVFDEDKRRDFLKGFHKRKLQRQKNAQEQLQKQLKEERKRIKQSAQERYKKLLSSRDVPELQQLLSQQEYETEGHTVSILEVNVADLAEGSSWIGENKGVDEESADDNAASDSNSVEDHNSDEDEVIGMTLKKVKPKTNVEKVTKPEKQEIGTKKDLKRALKKATLKQVKTSKVYQQKQKIERQKNKKESRRKLKNVQKTLKRSGKLKKKSGR